MKDKIMAYVLRLLGVKIEIHPTVFSGPELLAELNKIGKSKLKINKEKQ